MLFKQAAASIPAYIFERNSLTLTTGKIVAVVPSHVDTKTAKMVVDITISVDGKQQTYTIEDSLPVAYFGSSAISLDRETILREIEAMKAQSEQTLDNIDKHKEIVAKCTQMLLDNNPTLKEKKETEERFTSLESKMEKMMEMMSKLL